MPNKGCFKKGHKMSKEIKEKWRKAIKGRKCSDETRRKISEALKGHTVSKETREKLRKKAEEAWAASCSTECLSEYRTYGMRFNKRLKKKIRKRDKYTCQECKKTEKELEHTLHIHHIDYQKNNNFSANLISLCRKCHLLTSQRRNEWILYFQHLMEVKWNA